MAWKPFPWLADVIRKVQYELDQPEGDPSNLGYVEAEIVMACQDEQTELLMELTSLDKNFGMQIDTSLSVTSGQREFTLPTDCRFLRKVIELDAAGKEVVGGEVWSAYWEDLGISERQAIYMPDRNILHFMRVPTSTYSVKVVYGFYPVPLIHGTAQDGGATSITLADHESVEDDIYNGLTAYVWKGTGLGQTKVISDYVGSTRAATVSVAWTTNPDTTSRYTSRPNLPRDAADAFKYGVCSRLATKYAADQFLQKRAQFMRLCKQAMSLYQRQDPGTIRDDYRDGGYSDPYDLGAYP